MAGKLRITLLEGVAPHSAVTASIFWGIRSLKTHLILFDTNVVDVAIRRLRAKVDDPYPLKLIHTVRGMGYMLDLQA